MAATPVDTRSSDPVPDMPTGSKPTSPSRGVAEAEDAGETTVERCLTADSSVAEGGSSGEEEEQDDAETKAKLEAQASSLQSGLQALLERVEQVREQRDKLESENRFLQEYIGSLMATSKITGPARGRNSGGKLR